MEAGEALTGSATLGGMPRVAFLPDSFHEVNGVAHTARHYAAFAQRNDLPFLCVRAGTQQPALQQHGSVLSLELPRSKLSFAIEKDLSFDPLFFRHGAVLGHVLRHFEPDIIHITGPSELGMLGAYFAARLRIPLAASWHTNVHEYAARRLHGVGRWVPGFPRAAEKAALAATARLYGRASVLFAPNQELCDLLEWQTGRPVHPMPRGEDTALFHPGKRTRPLDDDTLLLGYVGRLSVEKNVQELPRIEQELRRAGIRNTRFVLVGQGAEEAKLRAALPDAVFCGVLKGEALAESYANMDVFVFPSETDTFGNVVLEALASGVPAIVTDRGGPRFLLRPGISGSALPLTAFASEIASLLRDPVRLAGMRKAARADSQSYTWDRVFQDVQRAYADTLCE